MKLDCLNQEENSKQEKKKLPPWGDKFILGIKLIDEQHEHLYSQINRIFENLRDGHRENNLIPDTLKELDQFSKIHFAYEEELFSNSDYPDVAKHIQEHQGFINKLSLLHDQSTNEFFDLKGALNILVEWFIHHSQQVDREYVQYIKKKSP